MTALAVMTAVAAANVQLIGDGDAIRCIGRPEAVRALLADLRTHKASLLNVLLAEVLAEAFEERAAIMEYDAGMTRTEAEQAARFLTYGN